MTAESIAFPRSGFCWTLLKPPGPGPAHSTWPVLPKEFHPHLVFNFVGHGYITYVSIAVRGESISVSSVLDCIKCNQVGHCLDLTVDTVTGAVSELDHE